MLKGAIIGFGEAGRHGHWPAYARSTELSIVAVVDRTEERRRLASALDPALRTYASFGALAAAESLDFIDICTPPALHAEPMLAALERGWHVVCEKPFLLDPDALEAVRSLSRERRLAVVPVHNWKFAPLIVAATDLLRTGAIGELQRVAIEVERLRDFKGADPERPNWRRDASVSGGGILLDHGWHALYLALHWFGAVPYGVDARIHRPSADAVEDEAEVRLLFRSGDAFISLSWNGTSRRNWIRLSGDCGSLTIDDDEVIWSAPSGDTVVASGDALSAGSHHADWFASFIPHLAASFRNPESSRAAFDEAAACLAIVRRAYEAGATAAAITTGGSHV